MFDKRIKKILISIGYPSCLSLVIAGYTSLSDSIPIPLEANAYLAFVDICKKYPECESKRFEDGPRIYEIENRFTNFTGDKNFFEKYRNIRSTSTHWGYVYNAVYAYEKDANLEMNKLFLPDILPQHLEIRVFKKKLLEKKLYSVVECLKYNFECDWDGHSPPKLTWKHFIHLIYQPNCGLDKIKLGYNFRGEKFLVTVILRQEDIYMI